VPTSAEVRKSRFVHKKQRKGSNNCGPTCLAIIAGITKEEACRKMFQQDRPAKYCYAWEADIYRGLEELQLHVSEERLNAKSFHGIGSLAIVSVEEDWHWIVYSPKEEGEPLIYDPQAKDPMTVSEYEDYCKKMYKRKYKSMSKIQYYIQARYPLKRRHSLRSRRPLNVASAFGD
jgi:ABC-type bacteriocin/lantibiotic exporter with double-glycine peptidase domain